MKHFRLNTSKHWWPENQNHKTGIETTNRYEHKCIQTDILSIQKSRRLNKVIFKVTTCSAINQFLMGDYLRVVTQDWLILKLI